MITKDRGTTKRQNSRAWYITSDAQLDLYPYSTLHNIEYSLHCNFLLFLFHLHVKKENFLFECSGADIVFTHSAILRSLSILPKLMPSVSSLELESIL
jgi:hypothetical protein